MIALSVGYEVQAPGSEGLSIGEEGSEDRTHHLLGGKLEGAEEEILAQCDATDLGGWEGHPDLIKLIRT